MTLEPPPGPVRRALGRWLPLLAFLEVLLIRAAMLCSYCS